MPLIFDRVQQARIGVNPKVICKMKSGWAVIGDVQFLLGKCTAVFFWGTWGVVEEDKKCNTEEDQ